MLSVLPPTFKPVLRQISLLQVDPNCVNTDFLLYKITLGLNHTRELCSLLQIKFALHLGR